MQLQDSVSEATLLNAHDALCQSVSNVTECLSAAPHLSRAGKIEDSGMQLDESGLPANKVFERDHEWRTCISQQDFIVAIFGIF